ncbi:hypothetical protein CDAR_398011 [Caerostris darwini]|uniref:Uncharacterized protein n=1 Tax=Caerostris darwini TaxID=1538125 RepID=A0AAV4MMG5_9ARAC|nr:hypothetical protein CDAR_398011 [Caerostris darwini]
MRSDGRIEGERRMEGLLNGLNGRIEGERRMGDTATTLQILGATGGRNEDGEDPVHVVVGCESCGETPENHPNSNCLIYAELAVLVPDVVVNITKD